MGCFIRAVASAVVAGATVPVAGAASAAEDASGTPDVQYPAPQAGYLDSHRDLQEPKERLGGPLDITIEQDGGVVFIALPDTRELDTRVFGVPGKPRAYGGTPWINGVPPELREKQEDGATVTAEKTPYGDKHTTMLGESFKLQARDVTATDAAVTQDRVEMTASWRDEDGNTYSVTCCTRMSAHGVEFPTFGGVVTNHLLHGFTRLGTPLMPTQFAHFAFWGMGEVRFNGQATGEPRLVHGMLTEYVREQGYKLAHDDGVRPKEDLHFHLMVPPMTPRPDGTGFMRDPVITGFERADGEMLGFWHVMFEQLDHEARPVR